MSKRKTIDQFIQDAIAVHGDRYDYSRVNYVSSKTKISIVCKNHGPFDQIPSNHLKGCGCPACRNEKLRSERVSHLYHFVEKAVYVHGDTYDYSESVYLNNRDKIKIICKTHGEFWQKPTHHLDGHGCKDCGSISQGKKKQLSIIDFKDAASKTHSHKYNYDESDYDGYDSVIKIHCPMHGYFYQRAHAHLGGCGCQSCASNGFNHDENAYLYLIKCKNNIFFKVGISNNPSARFKQLDRKTPFDIELVEYIEVEAKNALRIEKKLHNLGISARFKGFDGATEWVYPTPELFELWNSLLKTGAFAPK